jgi:NADH-quinone oxidoreductase subunit E
VSRFSTERVALAKEIIARYPQSTSAMVPLLHLAQEQDGYVTNDAMEHIAELIECSAAEVLGAASFYEMFKFHPVGKYVIGICTNISCLLQGADELVAHAQDRLGVKAGGTTDDGQFTLEDVECLAACTMAPCLQVNYRYFDNVTASDFDELVTNLRSGALDDTIPAHGVLARIRQHTEPSRWAGSCTMAPLTPETYTGPALTQ